MSAFQTALAFLLLVFAVCLRKFSCAVPPNEHGQAKQQILVLALGGFNGSPLDSLEIYSATSDSHLKNGASLPGPRAGFGSSIFNSTIHVVGGWNGSDCSDTFWSYSITQNKWNVDLPNVPSKVFGSAVVELGGRMYVLGGQTSKQPEQLMKQVFAYETHSRKWHTLDTQIPQISAEPCVVATENHLYYMPEGSLFRSDDGAKTWQKLSSPSESRTAAACITVGQDAILLAGGVEENFYLRSVEVYNITTNQWKTVASMNSFRVGGPAQLMLPSHENVLICGGEASYHAPVKDCEIYDWQSDQWNAASFAMNEARFNFGLFVTQANV